MSDPDRGIPDSSETTTHPSASTSAFPSAPAPPRPSDVDADAPPPPSTVADYDYPNVPDTTEPQQGEFPHPLPSALPNTDTRYSWRSFREKERRQTDEWTLAATGPGQGGVVNDPAEEKLPFKEQVGQSFAWDDRAL